MLGTAVGGGGVQDADQGAMQAHLHQKLPKPSAPRSFHTPDRSQCLSRAASTGSGTLPGVGQGEVRGSE